MSLSFDIAIVGSGFGGTLLAMILARIGRRVILLERGKHPRFAIGESSTPLANLILEDCAHTYDLPSIAPLAKWGAWQRTYPEITCGLKRGFTFYHHVLGQPYQPDPGHAAELMVAASPNEAVADTHWFRSDFDHFLLQEAQRLGVEYLDQVKLTEFCSLPNRAALRGSRSGETLDVRARLVIDATGPRGFLHNVLGLEEDSFPGLPQTQALFTHFRGVAPFAALQKNIPPYPPEQAAVHHIFAGGWIWVLHFNNGITSAGVAANAEQASRFHFHAHREGWGRLLKELPSVRETFSSAEAVQPFVHAARLSFLSKQIAGESWVMLPSAAGFVDPLLSTGFPLALLGVARLAQIIERSWSNGSLSSQLATYEDTTRKELLFTGELVAALYQNMAHFSIFRAVSLLYFAAASFNETSVRLGLRNVTDPFLMCEKTRLWERLQQCLRAPARDAAILWPRLAQEIQEVIHPFNIAGLGRAESRHWYGVDFQALRENSGKLGVPLSEINRLITRLGGSQGESFGGAGERGKSVSGVSPEGEPLAPIRESSKLPPVHSRQAS